MNPQAELFITQSIARLAAQGAGACWHYNHRHLQLPVVLAAEVSVVAFTMRLIIEAEVPLHTTIRVAGGSN